MRPVVGILLSSALVLSACGETSTSADGEMATARGGTTDWDSVVSQDRGSSLTVNLIGAKEGPLTEPCNANYEVAVEETPDQVVLTAYWLELVEPPDWPADQGCEAVGYRWEIEVQTSTDLGTRTIVDGHDRSVHQPIVLAEILSPTWLPEGWTKQWTGTHQGAITISYGSEDGEVPKLFFRVAPTDGQQNESFWLPAPPHQVTSEPISIKNITDPDARIVTFLEDGSNAVVLTENDKDYFIKFHGGADQATLTTVAESLSKG